MRSYRLLLLSVVFVVIPVGCPGADECYVLVSEFEGCDGEKSGAGGYDSPEDCGEIDTPVSLCEGRNSQQAPLWCVPFPELGGDSMCAITCLADGGCENLSDNADSHCDEGFCVHF